MWSISKFTPLFSVPGTTVCERIEDHSTGYGGNVISYEVSNLCHCTVFLTITAIPTIYENDSFFLVIVSACDHPM